MRQAWYRKYRPQTFSELIGQEHIKVTLLNQVKSGQVAHAYLFAGPKGTGKTSVARILAKSVNCLAPTSQHEACGRCANCEALANNTFVDLLEVDAASHTGVDNIRELTSKVELAPSLGKYKVYVIDEAHMLSKGAFNALLKTLEEPPEHALFILATTEPNKIPATIISRCQRFDFRHLSITDVTARLKVIAGHEGVEIDDEALAFLAEQAGGSLRDAESLLEQVASVGSKMGKADLSRWLGFVDWSAVVELTESLVGAHTDAVLARINQIYQDGYDLYRLAEMWARVVRQILAIKVGAQIVVSEAEAKKLQNLADKLQLNDLVWLAEEVMDLPVMIKQAVLPQMPFELLAVRAANRFGHHHDHDTNVPPAPAEESVDDQVEEVASVSSQPMASAVFDREAWISVVDEISLASPTIGAALARADVELDGEVLRLKFSLPFYKTAFEQNGYAHQLRDVLVGRGLECKIECVVDSRSRGDEQTGLELDEVSKVFN
ncbi:MAG: DNA polymerase III subunit gamma/tau [Patescibacteria group bacterium]|nr:DNA polymerase III subunit gamma/tau [Patescibacteria group bacterium]